MSGKNTRVGRQKKGETKRQRFVRNTQLVRESEYGLQDVDNTTNRLQYIDQQQAFHSGHLLQPLLTNPTRPSLLCGVLATARHNSSPPHGTIAGVQKVSITTTSNHRNRAVYSLEPTLHHPCTTWLVGLRQCLQCVCINSNAIHQNCLTQHQILDTSTSPRLPFHPGCSRLSHYRGLPQSPARHRFPRKKNCAW